ncbi:ADP-ribosylation factor 4-like [Penaeus japonicus]|uniref:ADP-ribosylation factor 4-like n=1 Tax=Penaeus japonicus TaxID=27405 RepID=UPI001C70B643|nr:ADP-ribosylation factor 4-like [Penaeus japonicus]
MGITLSHVWNRIFDRKKHRNIIMVGLSGAGKKTILNRLKFRGTYKTETKFGLDVTTVECLYFTFNAFDVGLEESPIVLRGSLAQGVDAVIYVVDAADGDRMQMAREELEAVLEIVNNPTTPLLVMVNKHDHHRALLVSEVIQALHMTQQARPWHVEGICASNLNGVYEGFDWLFEALE